MLVDGEVVRFIGIGKVGMEDEMTKNNHHLLGFHFHVWRWLIQMGESNKAGIYLQRPFKLAALFVSHSIDLA